MNIKKTLRCLTGPATFLAFVALLATSTVHAHFVWVYVNDGKARVVFGESLAPDQAQFLGGLSGMEAFVLRGGEFEGLSFEKIVEEEDGWFEATLDHGDHAVDVTCLYGVFGGGGKSMLLDYGAKYIRMGGLPIESSGKLKLDLVPKFVDGKLQIKAVFNGEAANDVEVQVYSKSSEMAIGNTGAEGTVSLAPGTRYVIRAKHTVAESGEHDGKAYAEKRFYCTLVLDAGEMKTETSATKVEAKAEVKTKSAVAISKVDAKLADFPRGMTSFGATMVGGNIYVMGGKSGKAHSYAKSYQNREVFCLDLKDGKSWTTVSENLGLQGLAIVGHEGKVYRIGGLEARNKEGEDHDLHSVADVKVFNPADKSWADLTPMPEGRSSFDASVADGTVYVAGGWEMAGEDGSIWANDILIMDLDDPKGTWESVEAPFRTRALAARIHDGKLYVIGGIKQKGGPTNEVHVFDLASREWSVGPEVPTEGGMKAFGCSAVTVSGQLLVTTYDGGVFRLADSGNDWEKVHDLENGGRFFHQMLPVDDNRFGLFGGSHMEYGSHFEVEIFEVSKLK